MFSKRKSGSITPADPQFDEFSPLLRSLSADETVKPTVYRIVPAVLLFALGYGTYLPSFFELMRFKICDQHLNYSREICHDIGGADHVEENDQIRKITAHYQVYTCILECLPGICLSFFLGSWSDHFGRKALMTFPFFGLLFASAWSALCSYRPFPVEYLLISAALSAIFGGRFVIQMAFYSFAGDISTSKSRAYNNAVVEGVNILGQHLGYLVSGLVYDYFGNVGPFLVCTGLFTLAIMYSLVFVYDWRKKSEMKTACERSGNLFSLSNLKEGFEVMTKERTGDTRFHIFLVVLACLISNSAFNGKQTITQLFLEFRPFSWTLAHYTRFASILGLAASFSVIFCAKIIRKIVGTDSAMAMVCYVSAISGYTIFSIASADWMIYLAAALGHLRMLCTVCIRSILQELAGPDDIGKIMAIVSIVQSVAPIIGAISFVNLFAATAYWWSGLCFAVGSFFLIIDLGIFAYIDVARRDWLYTKF